MNLNNNIKMLTDEHKKKRQNKCMCSLRKLKMFNVNRIKTERFSL